jgi:hypothetical protein
MLILHQKGLLCSYFIVMLILHLPLLTMSRGALREHACTLTRAFLLCELLRSAIACMHRDTCVFLPLDSTSMHAPWHMNTISEPSWEKCPNIQHTILRHAHSCSPEVRHRVAACIANLALEHNNIRDLIASNQHILVWMPLFAQPIQPTKPRKHARMHC